MRGRDLKDLRDLRRDKGLQPLAWKKGERLRRRRGGEQAGSLHHNGADKADGVVNG